MRQPAGAASQLKSELNLANEQPGPWFEIIGVVKDMSTTPEKTTEDAMLYRPRVLGGNSAARIVVHSRAADAPARLSAAGAATDPELRFGEVMTIDKVADKLERQIRGHHEARTNRKGQERASERLMAAAGEDED